MKPDCPFCRVVDKTSPQSSRILYEDRYFIGMLVNRPVTQGHFIVFPKKHVSEVSALGNKIGDLMLVTTKLAEKVTERLKVKAYTIKLNNKVFLLETDSLHVGHIHMHVIPRYVKAENLDRIAQEASSSDLQRVKNAIKLKDGQN